MALEEYRRKRDFRKTPEPAPGRARARAKGLSYLIQKHDATRLHYDFRLELDGVLLSWAVTKGPSLDPADKRLAVRTEDHPLSYGTFEGTIPKGQYGGGTVMMWDAGSWEPKGDPHFGLKKGHLAFTLHGERLTGDWDLIRMRGEGKRENWLLIKSKDDAAVSANGDLLERLSSSVKTGRSMPEIAAGLRPAKSGKRNESAVREIKALMKRYPGVQLATLVSHAPDGGEWVHEIKFDGYRLLGFLAGGGASLRTRNGNDWTTSFPAISVTLRKVKAKSAVVDMEAVVLDKEGKSSFQALQSALRENGDADSIIAFAFDLLHLNGEDLAKRPLVERKEELRKLLKKSKQDGVLNFSDHIAGRGRQVFDAACEKGLEGIVSKRGDAPYEMSRQKTWLKVKCGLRQEFIILGYSDAASGNRALGALYIGYKKDGALQYAGKVGTGFTLKSARDLVDRFETIAAAKPVLTRSETNGVGAGEWSAIHWVKPVLVCEVTFTEWTRDGRIRHPSFQGLRADKKASEVKQENPAPMSNTTTSSHAQTAPLVAAGVTITHPDRVISETGHVTKGDLAEYHAAVAPFLLPRIARHPLSLLRCPSGIDGGECFYQRSPGRGLGKNVHTFEFRHKGKRYEYLYIEDERGLLEVVQMGAIEIHPWGASVDAIDYPDRLIFDLDPDPEVPFEALKLAARDLRNRLKKRGLESFLKCTGGKGLHVTVALAGKDKWPEVKSFAGAVADEMVHDAPDAYVATMSKAKRVGKIFVDYFRNDYTATAIADYGVRARPGAPVAVPLEWDELKGLKSPSQFRMADVLKRLKHRKPGAKPKGQALPS